MLRVRLFLSAWQTVTTLIHLADYWILPRPLVCHPPLLSYRYDLLLHDHPRLVQK